MDDIGEVTITNDGATILKELEVEHPAARTLVELAERQDKEVGDGTTSVVILAAELLKVRVVPRAFPLSPSHCMMSDCPVRSCRGCGHAWGSADGESFFSCSFWFCFWVWPILRVGNCRGGVCG